MLYLLLTVSQQLSSGHSGCLAPRVPQGKLFTLSIEVRVVSRLIFIQNFENFPKLDKIRRTADIYVLAGKRWISMESVETGIDWEVGLWEPYYTRISLKLV